MSSIEITYIPMNQVLDETEGNTSSLRMFVTGLDLTSGGEVTAMLGGNNAGSFVDPPEVSSITPVGSEFEVVLELTGTVTPLVGSLAVNVGGDEQPEDSFDADLTVTITQDSISSDAVVVHALYINPNSGLLPEDSTPD